MISRTGVESRQRIPLIWKQTYSRCISIIVDEDEDEDQIIAQKRASGEITPDTLIIAHHVVSPPKRPPWTEPLRAVVPDNTPDQWRFRREHACIFGSEAPVLRIISALRLLRQIRSTVNKSRGLVCKLMQPVVQFIYRCTQARELWAACSVGNRHSVRQ